MQKIYIKSKKQRKNFNLKEQKTHWQTFRPRIYSVFVFCSRSLLKLQHVHHPWLFYFMNASWTCYYVNFTHVCNRSSCRSKIIDVGCENSLQFPIIVIPCHILTVRVPVYFDFPLSMISLASACHKSGATAFEKLLALAMYQIFTDWNLWQVWLHSCGSSNRVAAGQEKFKNFLIEISALFNNVANEFFYRKILVFSLTNTLTGCHLD